jgi:dissimilatory sulfite reductase (desulfoviridin) alpha/beta subunit
MKWTDEAEDAVKKVPFFVRKKVRTRVEKEAVAAGREIVSINDVQASQKRYLSDMSSEIKGYQLDICFGPGGCPNRAIEGDNLLQRIEAVLKEEDLLSFLKDRVPGKLKFHHEFRITLADCPNACSQPQIKDIGIIGASLPMVTQEACTLCEACVDACKEEAVSLDDVSEMPLIDMNRCVTCGKCIAACPTGTISEAQKGFRVQLGGKLGRHPQLARELPGIFSENEVLEILRACITFYKQNSKHGERFAELLKERDFDNLVKIYGKL